MKKRHQKRKSKPMSELRRARISAGFSINEVAQILNMHPSTISRYETGRIKQIPPHTLTRLRNLYDENEPLHIRRAAAYLRSVPEDIAEEFDLLDERGQKLVSALIRMEAEWADSE